MKTGIELISRERDRQIIIEGWSSEHDDQHSHGELASAAACYALHSKDSNYLAGYSNSSPIHWWPWDAGAWNPKDPIKDLVRAGALIAAEIDRLNRKDTSEKC